MKTAFERLESHNSLAYSDLCLVYVSLTVTLRGAWMRMELCILRPRQALRQASAVERAAVQRQRPKEDRCRSRLDTDQVSQSRLALSYIVLALHLSCALRAMLWWTAKVLRSSALPAEVTIDRLSAPDPYSL